MLNCQTDERGTIELNVAHGKRSWKEIIETIVERLKSQRVGVIQC